MDIDEGFSELYYSIEENKKIDDDNKEKILKEIARMKYNHRRDKIQKILDEFIVAYKNEDYKKMSKMMFDSPAGDGWGMENMSLKYGNKSEFGDQQDIFTIIDELKDEYNNMKGE